MGMHKEMQILIHKVVLLAAAAAVAKAGCLDRCGNVTIPYPFGTREGCYLDRSFLITCNATNASFLGSGNLQVKDISLDGYLRFFSFVARDCYNKTGDRVLHNKRQFKLATYTLSYSRNKFIAVGCDSYALIKFRGFEGQNYSTGCLSFCYTQDSVTNGSCSGIGCCQTSIPKGVKDFNISVSSYAGHSYVMDFNPCSYAFVFEDGIYNFTSSDFAELRSIESFPVVLDWAIGNKTCKKARKDLVTYACKKNSECLDYDNGLGYRCNCSSGYRGNPYLPNGCQEINECEDPNLHECISAENCRNTVGSYTCFCPKGYRGDGRKNGSRCVANQSLWPKVIVGLAVGISGLFMIITFGLLGVQKKKINQIKEKNFVENGGLLFQQLLSKMERSEEKAKIFSENELNKATNNFSQSAIIGQGGYGIVYRGILDNKAVAIKKSKVMDRNQIDQFVNEVMVLSQIRHPNVVKLIGCCLETQVPLLVYEFITNKTLHHHLQNEGNRSSFPWETRLNIAVETADALAHMHYDAPMRIIHRDVKSANILLDENFQAKVSDFGISRLVPLDQTQQSTLIQGTLGYIDPEYFQSGLLNEKSDVYSFGVVLVETLTGEKVISPNRLDQDKNLTGLFISSMKNDRLIAILDQRVKYEGNPEQLKGFAELAKCCLRLNGEKRPTMKEVKRELQVLRINKRSDVQIAADIEEAEPLLRPPTNFSSTNIPIDPESMKYQAFLEIESGR